LDHLPGCCFGHWLVYSLYRSLDHVRRKFVYTEFSFQFQSSWLAKQLGGPMFALSPEQQMQVAAVNRQARRVVAVFVVFGAIGFWGLSADWGGTLFGIGGRH
jgi:hypothetical protein